MNLENDLKRTISEMEKKNLRLQEQNQRIEFDYRMTIEKLQNEIYAVKETSNKRIFEMEQEITHHQSMRKKEIDEIRSAKQLMMTENEKLQFESQKNIHANISKI